MENTTKLEKYRQLNAKMSYVIDEIEKRCGNNLRHN